MPAGSPWFILCRLLAVAALASACATAAAGIPGWRRLADMPTARIYAGAAAHGGRIFVLGGCIVQNGEVMAMGAVESYDPAGDTWRRHAPLPTPRSAFGTGVVANRIFVVGGTVSDTREALDVVEAYDPEHDRWERRAPLPTPRSQVAVASAAGKVYAMGGNAGHEHAFEVYDPVCDRWSRLPPLATPRRNAGAVAIADRIFVFGGVTPDGWTVVGTLDEFDPATGQWTRHPPAPTARTDFAMVAAGSRIVVLGGFNKGPIASVEEYDIDARRWTTATDLPAPRQFPAAAVLEGAVYAAAGTPQLPAAGASLFARGVRAHTSEAACVIDYFGLPPAGETPILFEPHFLSQPGLYLQNAAFAPDGNEFAYTITDGDWSILYLMHTRRVSGAWTTPERFAFSTADCQCLVPFYSYDGQALYFIKQVPVGKSLTAELWVSRRSADGWADPRKVPEPINTGNRLLEFSFTRDGELYFSMQGHLWRNSVAIHRARPAGEGFAAPESLSDPINFLWGIDECPAIAPDGSYLVFNSFRGVWEGGGFGHNDLWVSFRQSDGQWTNPRNLGPEFNTAQADIYPYISPDGRFLFFTRRQKSYGCTEPSRLYWVSTRVLERYRTTNSAPRLTWPLAAQQARVGEPWAFTLADGFFVDDNANDRLTLTAHGLPSWMAFDPAGRTFTGTPAAAGDYTITILAQDEEQATCPALLKLFVTSR